MVEPPATTVATPSVLVMDRSACGVKVSVSVAELLPGVGSAIELETVAVFTRVPVAAAEIAQLAV